MCIFTFLNKCMNILTSNWMSNDENIILKKENDIDVVWIRYL